MTHHIAAMLDAYPKDVDNVGRDKLIACIEACIDCAQACTACADACLSEDGVADLTKCICTDLDCADVCETTGRAVPPHAYDAKLTRAIVQACAVACRSCGDECDRHASMHEHCRVMRRGLPPQRSRLHRPARRSWIALRYRRADLGPGNRDTPDVDVASANCLE